MTFLTELLCDVSNLIFKYIFKFRVDIPINARVTAAQSSQKSLIYIAAAMLCPPAYFTM